MTLHRNLALASETAFAVPDLLEFGMEAVLNLRPSDIPIIAERMKLQGFVDEHAKEKKSALHAVLNIPVRVRSDGDFKVRVELFIDPAEDGRTRIGNRSAITMNAMRLLRLVADMTDEPICFDGKRNVAGPTMSHPATRVAELMNAVADVVDQVVEELGSVMPEDFLVETQSMWLRKAELAHDATCLDPIGVTLGLGQSSFQSSIGTSTDVYRQTLSCSKDVPVVKWLISEAGVYLKVYAKADDLLRHEVSCLWRNSIAAITGRERADISGDTAASLAHSFITYATPLLVELVRHVGDVNSTSASPDVIVVKLGPIIELIIANASWSKEARAAWNSFVLTGRFDAKGLRKGTMLRDALEGLVGPDGPLLHGFRPTLYHLHPSLVQRRLS